MHSEIAHAVSDRPEGPFTTTGTVLASRNKTGWDRMNAHNPYAIIVKGKIYLYYISNDIRQVPDGQKLERKQIRNLQRIGMATAKNPQGPFKRTKEPVVEPHGAFKNLAVNPSVVFNKGAYTMIMKADDVAKSEWFRIQLVGHAAQPEGPFTFQDRPVYAKAQTEDACVWYDQDAQCYYMVCHRMGSPDLALFTSQDSYTWDLAANPVFAKKEIRLSDGSVWKPKRLERPFVLTDDRGKPVMLYVGVLSNNISGNIAIPLTDQD